MKRYAPFLVTVGLLFAAPPATRASDATPATAHASSQPARPLDLSAQALRKVIGCTHTAGKYCLTDKDYLNEGADTILACGMRIIKVYLFEPQAFYPFNSDWPRLETLVEIARHPYYQALFDKPFHTYFLTAYTPGKDAHYWRSGISETRARQEEQQFHDLTRYLLTRYRGTGKTFILQHWEGDWAVRLKVSRSPEYDPGPEAIGNMIRWLNLRQAGVERARRAVPDSDVKVYHACEVNRILFAMEGRPSVTTDVLPHTRCDLYSYSAYDTIGLMSKEPANGVKLFREALDFLATYAPDNALFGDRNIYIGEYGWPSVQSEQDPEASVETSMNVLRLTTETALDWGCRYLIYWQVYDNECRAEGTRPTNADTRGFYLIKPDGTPGPAWDYFHALLHPDSQTNCSP